MLKGIGYDPFESHAAMAPADDLPGGILSMYHQHSLQGAQRQADGAAIHVEDLRKAYQVSIAVAQAYAYRTSQESGDGMARVLPFPGALPGATTLPK